MRKVLKFVAPAFVVGALVLGVFALLVPDQALAAKGGKGGGGGGGGDKCPRTGIFCTTEYDPVICDDGNVYSNACFAYVACATGCEPYGDGGPVPVE